MSGSVGSSRENADTWVGATIRAAVMLVVSVIVFAWCPNGS